MTNREFFTAVSAGTMNEEIQAHAMEALEKMDSALAKRAEKPTKAQLENAPLREALINFVTENEGPHTEADLGIAIGVSHNKAGSIARQLVKEDIFTSTEIKLPKVGKRKAYALKKEEK